jgi:hypothetical protein
MVLKKYQNRNNAGRNFYKHQGNHLKKPNQNPANARHKSFCARMGGIPGAMMKNGAPTRKKLALDKWNCK